jgi:hypothetical protein
LANRDWLAGKISTKETNNKTPAASPNEKERNERLDRWVRKVSQLPIPVDNPAIIVRLNAMIIEEEIMWVQVDFIQRYNLFYKEKGVTLSFSIIF